MQNEVKKKKKENEKQKIFTFADRVSELYDESRNVTCFNCEQKKHYANECSKSRQSQMKKTRSSSITAQIILSTKTKERKKNLSKCILSDSIIIVITKSEEIKKKRVIQQVKEKRTILKRNERINDEHDRYVAQQENKEDESSNRDESNDMRIMSRMS